MKTGPDTPWWEYLLFIVVLALTLLWALCCAREPVIFGRPASHLGQPFPDQPPILMP